MAYLKLDLTTKDRLIIIIQTLPVKQKDTQKRQRHKYILEVYSPTTNETIQSNSFPEPCLFDSSVFPPHSLAIPFHLQ